MLSQQLSKHYESFLFTIVVLVIALAPHAINMFGYPYYEDDEGTYMAQARAVVIQGKLAPYTYWYDHAPIGWIQIGLWSTLTGGFHSFGFSINSGRVFMLVLHGLSTLMLIGICRKLFKSRIPILIAVIVFSFSPLAIHYQRRVLLDNIMTFWMLASLYLILGSNRKLLHYAISGIAFGLAFLSKESVIYILPAMLMVVFGYTRHYRTKFSFILWVILMGLIIAYYPLYASLQGELFPSGTALGGNNPHVSLLEALSFQSSRAGGFFLNADSAFMLNFRGWMETDSFLIVAGIVATIFVSLISIFKAEVRPIALITLFYWYFLTRGGIVIAFYIVPLVPLLALCIGAAVYYSIAFFTYSVKNRYIRTTLNLTGASLIFIPFIHVSANPPPTYSLNQTDNQIQAVQYVLDHVPSTAFVVSDMYAFIELRESMPRVHYYWKVDRDPEVSEGMLHDNWCNIDYLLSTPQLTADAERENLVLTAHAYKNSQVLASFSGTQWDVQIRKVDKKNCASHLMTNIHLTVVAE